MQQPGVAEVTCSNEYCRVKANKKSCTMHAAGTNDDDEHCVICRIV